MSPRVHLERFANAVIAQFLVRNGYTVDVVVSPDGERAGYDLLATATRRDPVKVDVKWVKDQSQASRIAKSKQARASRARGKVFSAIVVGAGREVFVDRALMPKLRYDPADVSVQPMDKVA